VQQKLVCREGAWWWVVAAELATPCRRRRHDSSHKSLVVTGGHRLSHIATPHTKTNYEINWSLTCAVQALKYSAVCERFSREHGCPAFHKYRSGTKQKCGVSKLTCRTSFNFYVVARASLHLENNTHAPSEGWICVAALKES
jgi:hypothetical protein